jgi:hypothetical protein
MSIVNGLLANKSFIIESLLAFVEEERHRIVGAGLVKQESCDRFLGGFLKKLAGDTNSDEMVSKLTALYESMQNVQLHGDRFFEEEAKMPTNTVNTTVSITPATEEVRVDKAALFLESRLEKLAYSLGSTGNHAMAYEVEKVIQNIKRGE